VFLTPGSRPGQRTSRTSHRGQVLHLSGRSDAERASAMAACNVFCAPCPEDGFGTSSLEAWSFARPVVAVSGPCLKELVTDGRDGLLVGQDAHAVATGLLRLLADPALAARLGAAGERKIADRFSWDRVVSTTESLLMRVCTQHRRHAVREPLITDAAPHQAMAIESELTEMSEPA
jgi:glycogen(starch) synthase